MKIRFNTDDNIPLNKMIYLPTITRTIKSVTKKDDKYYPQVFLDECLYQIIKRLEYDRIDFSEGIDINKTSASKECNICHYWYFFDKFDIRFSIFSIFFCNGCHDLMQKL